MKTLKFKPYLLEPLRSMKKMSTIRKSDKELKKDDELGIVRAETRLELMTSIINEIERI